MYTLTIVFRSFPQPLGFQFKQYKDANQAYTKLTGERTLDRLAAMKDEPGDYHFHVSDDFGNTAMVDVRDIVFHVLSDFRLQAEGNAGATMIQQRIQAKMNRELAADPSMRNAVALPGLGPLKQ